MDCQRAITEVADKIRKQFTDASGQFVDIERYKQSVTARYGDLEAFERTVRDDIAQEKLRAFVTAAINVSDNEVQEDFKRKQTQFDVIYTIVSADKLAEKIQPTEEELKSYYEQHKDDFKITVPQKKIRYVYVDQAGQARSSRFQTRNSVMNLISCRLKTNSRALRCNRLC